MNSFADQDPGLGCRTPWYTCKGRPFQTSGVGLSDPCQLPSDTVLLAAGICSASSFRALGTFAFYIPGTSIVHKRGRAELSKPPRRYQVSAHH
jgi:hypothetical protein